MFRNKATDDANMPFLELAESELKRAAVPDLLLIAKALKLLIEKVMVIRDSMERRDFLASVKELEVAMRYTMKMAEAVVREYDGTWGDLSELKGMIRQSGKLREQTQGLLSTIGELQELAGGLTGEAELHGFVKSVAYDNQNQAILVDMKKAMVRAMESSKCCDLVSGQSIFDDIKAAKEMQRQFREAKDQRIIDSIPRADAGYRSVDAFTGDIMQGPREQLLELDLWTAGRYRFRGNELKQVCLLSGGAGLGKSSIVHQFCARLDATRAAVKFSPRLGASFFFARGGGDLEDAHLFFPTLTYQLALSRRTLRPHIAHAAQEYLQPDGERQMHHAFERLQSALRAALTIDQPPTFLVVDGIDECRDTHLVPDLLQYLLVLVRQLPWLYVLVASRPEPRILSVLASSSSANVVHHIRLEDMLED